MKIRYALLKKKDSVFFSFLDPYEKLRILSLPFGLAIGAIDEEGDITIPVGLLVASVSDETLITEWLVVSPDYRWSGIGEGLLYRAFEAASALLLSTVQAFFMPEYEKEGLLKNSESFFAERMFRIKRKAGADVDLFLPDLTIPAGIKNCVPLSRMASADRKKCIEKLSGIDNALYTFGPGIILPGMDNDISVICQNNNTLEGGLLSCVADGTVYPLYHYATSEAVSDSMIATVAEAAKKKYGRNVNISLLIRQPGAEEATERVFGKIPLGVMLEASVMEFDEFRREE